MIVLASGVLAFVIFAAAAAAFAIGPPLAGALQTDVLSTQIAIFMATALLGFSLPPNTYLRLWHKLSRYTFRQIASWLVVITMAAVGAVYLYQRDVERKRIRGETEAYLAAKRKALDDAVASMALNANAVSDWDLELSQGQRLRQTPFMTFELERAWLIGRPIFIAGPIQDIANDAPGYYRIAIQQDRISAARPIFVRPVEFSIRCPKSVVDQALTPNFYRGIGLERRAAVVANIHAVQAANASHENVSASHVGVGECLDMLYLGGR